MTEEQRFPRTQSARLVTIRSLSAKTKGPVRVMCIVVDSRPGTALVQDIYDEVGKARQIRVSVDGLLEVAQRYMLLGDITEKSAPDGSELMLAVSLVSNINSLNLEEYKQALELEQKVAHTLSR